jgi:hypothetical protein
VNVTEKERREAVTELYRQRTKWNGVVTEDPQTALARETHITRINQELRKLGERI